MSILYNERLEELMKIQSEMSEEENEHFLNEFRKSELLVPLQIELDSLDLENMNLEGLKDKFKPDEIEAYQGMIQSLSHVIIDLARDGGFDRAANL